jgi:hypothetical protein
MRVMRSLAAPWTGVIVLAVVVTLPCRVRADPWFDRGEEALEDSYADGDFDEEDHVAMHLGGHVGASDVHGESWVSVVGFTRELLSGKSDIGGMLVVGLPFDRLSAGPVHRIADPPSPSAAPPLPSPASTRDGLGVTSRPSSPAPLIAQSLARNCVAAAWRASGLGVDDSRLDSMVARSRASAILPETRVRAMRLWDDASHTTTLATTDSMNYYAAIGANLVLELRLTWRLDRLVYAGDEPSLERARLDRLDARSRLATRTLEGLFAWARAKLDAGDAEAGSREEAEARLQLAETEATLDVLTGGWFSDAVLAARHEDGPASP